MIAITASKIYTVSGGMIENGTILVNDCGKIEAIGQNVAIPAGVEVYDYPGCTVTPGFIDAHTHISTFAEPNPRPVIHDGNERSAPNTAQIRGIDGLNPFDIAIPISRSAGFTTCYTGPGSGNVIAGTGVAFKLRDGATVLDIAIPGTEMMKMAMGENPKTCYGSKDQYPVTRMGVGALLREALFNAKVYSDEKLAFEEGRSEKAPKPDFRLESLVPVVRGEMKCRIHCHRADDIVTAVRIAEEFNLDFSIEHCTEGYMILDFLKEHNVTAVVGPLDMSPAKMEIWNKKLSTPGKMEEAGINFCLTQDTASHTRFLPVWTGLAIANGLSWNTALEALTIRPAKLLGIADRVGSLEVGKDADIAVFDGDPFCNYTHCKATFIDGKFYAPVEE